MIGYYSCNHSTSNTPCPICQPGAPVMPSYWPDIFKSDEPGVSDATNLKDDS
jgi:hypothetical protein